MTAEARTPEFRPGQWLTQCAYHPFTFWSGDTFLDAEGKIRCNQFCGKYRGARTTREQDAIIAASHHLREAPSPPHTRPRPTGFPHFQPYDRWPMQKTAARLEGDCGHDGLPLTVPATVVPGRRGPAFRFTADAGYSIQASAGAMPTTGMAVAVWVSLAADAALGTIIKKGTDFIFAAGDAVVEILYNAGLTSYALGSGWHHVATDWNGTTTTVYVDGVAVATSALEPTVGDRTPIQVGGGLVGDMYDLRYFMRSFDDGELLEIMGT